MENPSSFMNLNNIDIIIYTLKMFFISIYTYYTYYHILNMKLKIDYKFAITIFLTFIISFLYTILKYYYSVNIVVFIISLSIIHYFTNSSKIGYSIIITLSSLSMNYIIHFISIIVCFIPNVILGIQNDVVSLISILTIHFVLLFCFFKIKRFKNGFSFFQNNLINEYFDLLTLDISTIVMFTSVLFNTRYSIELRSNLFICFIILAIIMFITIQKSLTLYYKHNLLVKDLNDTKLELEEKNKEIEKLEKENLEFSKTSHSIAHKQHALEYKLNQLMMNTEISDELNISDKIKNVSSEIFDNKTISILPKTDIDEIDDMLEFMQAECNNNNIDFELSLSGNIHHMVNKFISKEDLSILLADHIKNSIIAINNSDNINRSILIKLGLIDNYYSLYVYDSGIEFEPDTLSNLGKKPTTTHKDTGGTGFGFMNTFDTLKKYNASLIINELNPPCKDNYTKSIVIRFDDKNEFIVNSYNK